MSHQATIALFQKFRVYATKMLGGFLPREIVADTNDWPEMADLGGMSAERNDAPNIWESFSPGPVPIYVNHSLVSAPIHCKQMENSIETNLKQLL